MGWEYCTKEELSEEGQHGKGYNNAEDYQDCDYHVHFGMQLHGPIKEYLEELQAYISDK